MKKGKVFFHPIEGAGSLTISWSNKPKGDAIEAKKGTGVGFFSDTGELLCVIFDEVLEAQDFQILEFANKIIELRINDGKIAYTVREKKTSRNPKKPNKRPASNRRSSRLFL